MNTQFSVIIPALNEADRINHTLARLPEPGPDEDLEIVVVDGSPHGDTLAAITRSGVKKILAGAGRGAQMNHGAFIARGEILIFLHADTVLESDAFEKIRIAFVRKNVVGGAFELGIQSKKNIFRVIETAVVLRSRILHLPYGDQAIFLKKNFFHQIGGFRDIPIMEDVDLMRRIRKAGKKITILPSKVQTSPRRWEKEGAVYCTVRNWILMALFTAGVSPAKLARYYR